MASLESCARKKSRVRVVMSPTTVYVPRLHEERVYRRVRKEGQRVSHVYSRGGSRGGRRLYSLCEHFIFILACFTARMCPFLPDCMMRRDGVRKMSIRCPANPGKENTFKDRARRKRYKGTGEGDQKKKHRNGNMERETPFFSFTSTKLSFLLSSIYLLTLYDILYDCRVTLYINGHCHTFTYFEDEILLISKNYNMYFTYEIQIRSQ